MAAAKPNLEDVLFVDLMPFIASSAPPNPTSISFSLVNELVALMDSEHVGPFNLGNPGEFTMLELAQVIKETIDSSATIEYRPNTTDDPHMRKLDISKVKELAELGAKSPTERRVASYG